MGKQSLLKGPGWSWLVEVGYAGQQVPVSLPTALQTPMIQFTFFFFLFQFFSCLVMIAYGVSAFFSFQAWRGVGSNAATSQMAAGYA